MNQLSAETTVDARSFMVYVERPEEEVKGEIIFMIIIIGVIVDIFKSIILVEHQNKENLIHISQSWHILYDYINIASFSDTALPVKGYCAPYNGAVCRNYIHG